MRKLSSILLASLGILFGHAMLDVGAEAADVTSYRLPNTVPMSAEAAAKAKPVLPMLKDASQLPRAEFVKIRGASATQGSAGSRSAPKAVSHSGANDDVAPMGFGTANHPFTTKGAFSTFSSSPTNLHPWRPTGKLLFTRKGQNFVCSASMIKKGILVTAAHCVVDFGGTQTFNSATSFQPARFDATTPFGTIVGVQIFVPTAYRNGTDTCTVAGVVCENDVAVVALASNIGLTTGFYGVGVNGFGYTDSLFLGKNAALINQLGYPVLFNSGLRMIRTDSLGFFATPNNVIIGSDQTGGSSGGPWLVNFGATPVSGNTVPLENTSNVVVATTSWGFISGAIKQQGASRFGNNTKFPGPGPTNITALINAACALHPLKC
ncbi:MAG: trypsin-like serine peptidase [Hyphomicrobiales bacterium]